MAMVLPATVLRQLSSEGVRKLLRRRYVIEYIIQSGYRLAFSESTSFREILLVAKKVQSGTGKQACIVARLGTMPTEHNLSSIEALLKELSKSGKVTKALEDKARSIKAEVLAIPQESFRKEQNWQQLLPRERFAGFSLPSSPFLALLEDTGAQVVQGIRFHENSDRVDVKNTVLSKPRAKVDVKINWRIVSEKKTAVDATSTETGVTVTVPRKVLRPTTRSPAGMETMELVDPPDYIVVGRFPGDELFWDDPDPDALLARRLPHLESREAFLVAAGRNNVNLASKGTHLLGFVCREPIPPTWSFWSIRTASLEDSRLLALWWNSTFHLVQLMESRAEVGGSWVGWLKDTLLQLTALKPTALTPEARRDLLRVYETWKAKPFPSLLDQLEKHFEGRIAIDTAIAKALGTSVEELGLTSLYDTLAARIKSLGNLLTGE